MGFSFLCRDNLSGLTDTLPPPHRISFYEDRHLSNFPSRDDIAGWFDLLDVDDFVSFGGKA